MAEVCKRSFDINWKLQTTTTMSDIAPKKQIHCYRKARGMI